MPIFFLEFFLLSFFAPQLTTAAYSAPTAKHDIVQPAVSYSPQVFNFGTFGSVTTTPIRHTFFFQNNSQNVIIITRLLPSCGCTSAVLSGKEFRSLPLPVLPGQQIPVEVSVNPVQLTPGPIRKIISVFIQGQAASIATLEMVGTLQSSAVFSPPILDFGRVTGGDARKISLTVTLNDPSLKARPRLVSTDPDVLTAAATSRAGTTGKQLSFNVTLSPRTPLGPLQARLYLMPLPDAENAVAARRASMSVPVFAEVVGRISAEPAAVAFGTVTAGTAASQRVELTAATPDAFHGLKVLSAYPNLIPVVSVPPDSTTARPRLLITLTLDPDTPVTSLKTQVLVMTAAGERLVIPIFADVVPR